MAFDAFLKISTIPGESTDEQHPQWIEILSFSHGLSQTSTGSVSTGGARTAGRVDHQDLTVVKALDAASTPLYLACCRGDHIPEVTIQLHRATGNKEKYYEVKMTDVLVSGVRPGGSSQGGESLPLEEVSFNYAKVEWNYIQTDHNTGAVQGNFAKWWDLKTNTGG